MENNLEFVNIKEILAPRVLLKKHSKNQISEICNSIKEFGQYRPILIQKSSMRIICGYGVFLALKKLKYKEVLVKKLDVSDEEADNIRFTDNYSNESSKWNEDKLQYLFMEIPNELIEISGFEIEEVENIFNDSIELLQRGIEKSEKIDEKVLETVENLEEAVEETKTEINEENVVTTEKKDKISDVEFIKIRFCGCCGKYYDSDGNEVELLR